MLPVTVPTLYTGTVVATGVVALAAGAAAFHLWSTRGAGGLRRNPINTTRVPGPAAKLRELNLRVVRMPGGRWSVFSARGSTFYHTFGPGPGSRDQAFAWAWAFGNGRTTSPYGVSYRRNPIVRSTFGVLPSYADFFAHLSDLDDEGKPYLAGKMKLYPIEVHEGSEDGRLLRRLRRVPAGYGSHGRLLYRFDPSQLYNLIRQLVKLGREDADSFASSIMSTLGYEWI